MKWFIALVTSGLVFVSTAPAAIVTYTNRAAFDAAFANANRENWDGFANGTVIPNGTTVNGITYNSSFGDALVTNQFAATTNPNTLGQSADGFFFPEDAMTFTFSRPLSAFGIDINTFATDNGAYTATTNNGDVISSFFDPFPGFGTGQFIGFFSTVPFTSVTITASDPVNGVSFTLDTLRAQVVPEPATLAVFGLMAAGAFGVRRRLKAAA